MMEERKKLASGESVFLLAVTVLSLIPALWNLGSRHIPSTGWERQETGGEILLDLGKNKTQPGGIRI